MPYKLKSNEEITKAFDKEEKANIHLLKSNILKAARKLAELQYVYKQLTGRNFNLFD